MPAPGPWLQDPPDTITWIYTSPSGDVPGGNWANQGTDFPTICESPGGGFAAPGGASVTANVAGNFDTDFDSNPVVAGDFLGYTQQGSRLQFLLFTIGAIFPMDGFHLGTPPANAIDFQVEGHGEGEAVDPDVSWIISDVDVTNDGWHLNADWDTDHALAGELQVRLTPAPHSSGTLGDFISGAALATLPLLTSHAIAVDGVTDELWVPTFTIARSAIPSSGPDAYIEISVDVRAVIDHTAPSHGYDPTNTSRQEWGFGAALGNPAILGNPCTYTLTATYRRPRYRWILDIAPAQRQFPRDDGLGASTRRSWPPPTSKQYGLRRGAAATYQ